MSAQIPLADAQRMVAAIRQGDGERLVDHIAAEFAVAADHQPLHVPFAELIALACWLVNLPPAAAPQDSWVSVEYALRVLDAIERDLPRSYRELHETMDAVPVPVEFDAMAMAASDIAQLDEDATNCFLDDGRFDAGDIGDWCARWARDQRVVYR